MKRLDLLGLLVAAALGILYGWPLVALGRAAAWPAVGLSGTSGSLFDAAMTGELGRPLSLALESLRVVLAAELVAVPLGVLLAVLVSRTDLAGRQLLVVLLAAAVFVPLPLHAAGWLGSFGNLGREQFLGLPPLLREWWGAGFVHGVSGLPLVVLIVSVGLLGVNPGHEESALLETSPWRVLMRVSLPAAVGHVAAAVLAVAVLTAGEMTVTDLLQVRTYAEEAYLQAQLGNGPAAAASVALPPLMVLGGLVVLGMRVLRRRGTAIRTVRGEVKRYEMGVWRYVLGLVVVGTVGALLALPVAGMVWRAGRVAGEARLERGPEWSWEGLGGTLTRAWPDLVEPSALAFVPSQAVAERVVAWVLGSPLLATTLWAAIGASLAVGLGLGLSWKARGSGFWSWVLAGVTAVGLATPGPVVGMALKLGFVGVPWVHNTPMIVVLGYVARVLPYVLLIVWPVLLAIPKVQVESAELEGYAGLRLLGRVGYPACQSALRAAWAVGFVLALGELSATNLLQPPGLRTLTFQVWSLLHYGTESHLSGVGLILLGVYGAAGLSAAGLLRWVVRRAVAGR